MSDAQLRHHHRLGASRRHVRVARQDLRVRSTLFGLPHRNTRPSPPRRPCGHVHVVDPRPKAMSSSLAKAAVLVTVPEAGFGGHRGAPLVPAPGRAAVGGSGAAQGVAHERSLGVHHEERGGATIISATVSMRFTLVPFQER
jgi:hypothetical protein